MGMEVTIPRPSRSWQSRKVPVQLQCKDDNDTAEHNREAAFENAETSGNERSDRACILPISVTSRMELATQNPHHFLHPNHPKMHLKPRHGPWLELDLAELRTRNPRCYVFPPLACPSPTLSFASSYVLVSRMATPLPLVTHGQCLCPRQLDHGGYFGGAGVDAAGSASCGGICGGRGKGACWDDGGLLDEYLDGSTCSVNT